MYLFITIFILILLLFFCINHWHRKKIIKRVCSMCPREKHEILNKLLAPFGYFYVPSQDIISSRTDAWQRGFGYQALFDKAASYTGMVIDCLPVYFDYQGRTWLIEFWKGQYGINTGCEIGVYYADRILKKSELTHTLFQCADNQDMLNLSFTLAKDSQVIAKLNDRHWWLTAFIPSLFSSPSDLSMHICVTLASREMAVAFANGLQNAGYRAKEFSLCNRSVTFTFANSAPIRSMLQRLRICLVQFFNRLLCGVFLFLTRPFHLVMDRLLYLYYFLPFAFRKMLHMKKDRKCRVNI